MHRKLDRRQRRTKQALSLALLRLLRRMPWERVAISALCAEADIARSTFYLHYRTRQDLLEDSFRLLSAQLRRQLVADQASDPIRLIHLICDHSLADRQGLAGVLGNRGSTAVRERFQSTIFELLTEREVLQAPLSVEDGLFVAAGFIAICGLYLNRPDRTLDEFKDVAGRLTGSVLAGARHA